jgi:hypothetical protein
MPAMMVDFIAGLVVDFAASDYIGNELLEYCGTTDSSKIRFLTLHFTGG